jgi:hypothetical protein
MKRAPIECPEEREYLGAAHTRARWAWPGLDRVRTRKDQYVLSKCYSLSRIVAL